MGKIEWAMWANEQALASSTILIIGGILAVIGKYDLWGIGVYAIIAGIVMFVIEYPRGKRGKGTTLERRFQRPFTVVISSGRLLTRNYFIRFVIYVGSSVPCCFILQTVLGAMCLMLTSLIYLLAAIKGEEWLPVKPEDDQPGPKVIAEPKRPPPRRPDNPNPSASQLENRV